MPEEASTQAGPIDTLYDVLARGLGVRLRARDEHPARGVVHFRKRRHDDLRDGEPIHGNTRLEVVWTTIPALLMVGAAVYSGLVLADIEEPKANTQTVNVTGEQFAWTFEYQQPQAPRRRAAPGQGHALPLQAPRQGRDPLVLGAGVPDEEGRGARA